MKLLSALLRLLNRQSPVPVDGNSISPLPRRILIACDYYWPSVGGVELFVEDLGTQLMQARFQVEIAARRMPERNKLMHRGMPIHEFTCDGGLWSGGAFGEIAEYCQFVFSGKFEVVILLSQPDNWVPSCLSVNRTIGHPKIIMMPSINAINVFDWTKDNRLHEVSRILGSADEIICASESGLDAQFVKQMGIQGHFIPHATGMDAAKENFRKSYDFRDDKPLLVMVANFWPVKNHFGLLEILATTTGEWQLAIIGNPIAVRSQHFKMCCAQAARDSRVRILGGLPREVAAAAIRDADLLLVPSLGESAGPLVVIQAMSYSTPWIATPECNAVHDEAGGIVTHLENFPGTIDQLLQDPDRRAELGRIGREHWQCCFTWERSLPAYVALIEGRYPLPDLRMPSHLRNPTRDISATISLEARKPKT